MSKSAKEIEKELEIAKMLLTDALYHMGRMGVLKPIQRRIVRFLHVPPTKANQNEKRLEVATAPVSMEK